MPKKLGGIRKAPKSFFNQWFSLRGIPIRKWWDDEVLSKFLKGGKK